ncbi:hypothetical protein MKX01_042708, partial [Papaver californicum]
MLWKRVKMNDVDRVKVALLYVVHRFLYGDQNFVIDKKEKPEGLPSIHPQGMACVLVVWVVQVFPEFFRKCVKKIDINGWLPHILTVFCINALTHGKVIVEGPLRDKVVVEEVSIIVQQPHSSQGNVHMEDAVKESNGMEEQA